METSRGECRADPRSTTRRYSGHDYSILSFLGACGVTDYAPPALGFGAYVVVEHLAGGGRRLLLNPAPFRDAAGATTATVDTSRARSVAVDEGLALGFVPERDVDLGTRDRCASR